MGDFLLFDDPGLRLFLGPASAAEVVVVHVQRRRLLAHQGLFALLGRILVGLFVIELLLGVIIADPLLFHYRSQLPVNGTSTSRSARPAVKAAGRRVLIAAVAEAAALPIPGRGASACRTLAVAGCPIAEAAALSVPGRALASALLPVARRGTRPTIFPERIIRTPRRRLLLGRFGGRRRGRLRCSGRHGRLPLFL